MASSSLGAMKTNNLLVQAGMSDRAGHFHAAGFHIKGFKVIDRNLLVVAPLAALRIIVCKWQETTRVQRRTALR